MNYSSKFAENLKDLIQDSGITKSELITNLNIKRRTLNSWLSGNMPSLSNLILLADYFKCSIDFLIGIEENNLNPNPNLNRPNFNEQFHEFLKTHETNIYNLSQRIKISSTSVIYDWLNGKKEPSIETLILIAKEFNTNIDSILGR